MPTKDNADKHPTHSIHQGRHLNSVSDNVAQKMDKILEKGLKQNWTEEQYKSELEKMLANERVELKAGNIKLNKNCRPWAN